MSGPLVSRRRWLIAVDALVLAATGASLALGQPSARDALPIVGAGLSLLGVLRLAGGYRLSAGRRARLVALRGAVPAAFAALALGAHAALAAHPAWATAALAAASLAGAALIPLALAAVLYLRVVADSWLEERVLLIGSGPLAAELAENIARLRPFGLRVAGHLDDDDLCDVGGALGAHLGQLDQLEKVLRVFAIERVVVTLDAADTASIEEMLVSARLGGVCVESGAECGEWLLRQLPLAAPTRQLFLEGPGWETYWLYEAGKRAIDVAVAAAALVVAGPLIGLAALAIRLESPGPALFRQVRIGRRGRPFQIAKLRSMWVDAERHGYALATRGDPRITRLGGFLRRSRIDELPQLWNVLRGEMSLVGPRPERPELYDALADEFPLFRRRLAVRPGLTGWAQVHQGYVNDVAGFGIKLAYDLFYVKRRSLRIDLKIVWRTLRELMQLRGV